MVMIMKHVGQELMHARNLVVKMDRHVLLLPSNAGNDILHAARSLHHKQVDMDYEPAVSCL